MIRKEIGSIFDRNNRNAMNDNFEYLFEGSKKIEELNNRADSVLNEAKKTNDMNKNVQQQINTLIAESGTSDAEVLQARIDAEGNEYPVLKDRLDENDAQLAQNTAQLEVVTKNPNNYDGAIVVIIDDDIRSEVSSIWQPVLDDTGAKITFACITGRVGTDGYMTLQEVKNLQSQGHEIVSHTVNHQVTSDITVSSAETEYPQSQQWLKDNGFKGFDTLVYPGGMPTNKIEIKNVARKHYKYAVATNHESGVIDGTFDSWRVPRVEGDVSTLEQLKTELDKAISEKSLLLIMTHSHVLGSVGSQKMRDFITHTQSLNVPIMTFGEAMKLKGNAIAIGEYTDPASTFVSVTGASKLGSGLIVGKGVNGEFDKPITEYPKNSKTVKILTFVADTFQSKGGVYEVFRSHDDFYSYATFRTHDSNVVYQRKWDYTNKLWKSWESLSRQTYSVGYWTPKLEGTTVAGNHTYRTQLGSWTKFANMITVRFDIRIVASELDSLMNGFIKISGLPFSADSNMIGKPMQSIEYNKLIFGTGYYNAMVGISGNGEKLDLYKSGNDVYTGFLHRNEIPSGEDVVFRGQLTYQIPQTI